MKSSTAATIATSLLASSISVSAQEQYTIDPNSVANYTRQAWCQDQTSQCPLICQDQGFSGTTLSNECDSDSLTYSCVCDNGLSPNVTEYSQTLPYNICTAWGSQCVSNCGTGNTACAAACQQAHPCGALNPTRQNTSTLTRTRTTTGAATGSSSVGVVTTDSAGETVTVYTGFGGGGASATGGNGGDESAASTNMVKVWALSAGQTFGTLGVVGAAALGFAVML